LTEFSEVQRFLGALEHIHSPKTGVCWTVSTTISEGGEKMRKRITLLIAALMLALSMSMGVAGGAFAAKTETFAKGTCTVKAGQGGGGGEIKDQHHGQCHSHGADV
jgi:hypothetical protein